MKPVISPSYSTFFVAGAVWGSPANPVDVEPGDRNVPLTVTLQYLDTPGATSIHAWLELPNGFTDVNGSQKAFAYAGGVGTNSYFSLIFNLNIEADAVIGNYTMTLDIYWSVYSPANDYNHESVPVPVNFNRYSDITLQKISISPPKVYPGDKNVDLKLSFTNAGSATAKNVEVEIMQTQYVRPSWGGADTFFIGTVQPGQTVPADFYIDVDDSAPSPSNLTLIAKIMYGTMKDPEKSVEIPLFLSAKAGFVVTSTKIPEIHVSDTGIVILVTFKNNGTEAAQGASVQIEVPNVFSGTTTDYFGTVEAGEEKTATFVIDINSNAEIGNHVLNLRLSWSQPEATHIFTQDLSLELNILENPLSKLLPIILILLAIVAVAIIVVVRRRFHSSKMQPKQT
jgi:hypothetical protein